MARKAGGFTLIEALVVMGVAAALAMVAVPAWRGAVASAHAAKARGALGTALLDAIRHSGLTGVEVVLCPSSDGHRCTGGIDWSAGWIGFADLDGNRRPDEGDTHLLREAALPDGTRLVTSRGRPRIVFQPGGGNAGSNVTFTLCDRRGPEYASAIVLANTGRLRQRRPTLAQALACIATTPG